MSKKEIVVSGAIRLKVNFNGIMRDVDIPYISSKNEFHIEEFRRSILRVMNYRIIKETEGFITNKKRFVDSQEAMKIALGNDQVSEARSLWDIFKKAKNCKERNSIEEAINRRTKILLERGLLPEDLY